LVESLPAELRGTLPSVAELEAELQAAGAAPEPRRWPKKRT
jgi:hypothetical protein